MSQWWLLNGEFERVTEKRRQRDRRIKRNSKKPEGGRERERVLSLVTVDMHKGLNGNRAETRRNQTATCTEEKRVTRAIGKTSRQATWTPDASSRIHFTSKGLLFFASANLHSLYSVINLCLLLPIRTVLVNRITLSERRINFSTVKQR